MERQIAELIEKEAIREQIYNYCRALDRIDNELGYSVFAEDSKVDYGPTYKGDGRGFIDMMLNMHRTMVSTHHMMTNILIKFNEDMTPVRPARPTCTPAASTRIRRRGQLRRRGPLPRHRQVGEA